ncbi:hypothetical protein MA20_45560 [Bradyrhizobium japonicum]|uniref:Uncharacterized protein n=1 Tax=Bradyrhizobium japonicum TaxID=375 RepID=A0A0A3YHQ1_BRAJP|nr:hypothetical protein MA20_45560 [Bradyrhizobium japonicum]
MTVFVYVNTAKQVGDIEHIKISATVYDVTECCGADNQRHIVGGFRALRPAAFNASVESCRCDAASSSFEATYAGADAVAKALLAHSVLRPVVSSFLISCCSTRVRERKSISR